MKKVKLIKSLLISAPIIVTPLLANSCDSKKDSGNKSIPATKINDNASTNQSALTPATKVDAEYYVNALAGTLKTELDSIADQVVATAAGNNTLNITSVINTAKSEAKKIATFNPDNIDNINLAFNGTGNLKVEKNNDTYTLTVFPSFINSSSTEQTLTTTLSLTFGNNTDTQAITNTYNIVKGFKNYTTSAGLGNNQVNSIYVSNDGNTIYAGTANGVSVGTNANNTYTFQNYTTAAGLGNNTVNSVYASNNGNTIYAGTSGGFSVGTKNSEGTYTFKNYTTADGLGDSFVYSVYASSDDNTVYAATPRGVSVGIKKGPVYVFNNYTTGLSSDILSSVYASSDGNTIYTGSFYLGVGTSGVSVGTKSGDTYTFQNYTTADGLGSPLINSVYASSNGNTIYAGTANGVSVGTKQSGSNRYTFQNYTSGLTSTIIRSVYASSNGNTIYVGTNEGVAEGTKANNTYTFQNYTQGLGNKITVSVYASSNGNTIYAGTRGGLSITSSNWFTQNNLSYSINNYQAIVLNNKNNN